MTSNLNTLPSVHPECHQPLVPRAPLQGLLNLRPEPCATINMSDVSGRLLHSQNGILIKEGSLVNRNRQQKRTMSIASDTDVSE